MKSFATVVLIAASASIASAQVTYNSTTGVFTCPASNPNGAFCASDSLTGNIIIRCTNGVGQPGNCNDNLAGEPPLGVNYSPCWETSNTSGDAACSKNCIVYGGPGNGTFTLPNCTPISSTSSSTSSTSTTSASSSSTVSTTASTSSSTSSSSSGTKSSTTSVSTTGTTSGTATTTSTTITATVTTVCTTGTTTFTSTYTTTYCPSSTLSTIALPTGGSTASSNGTISTSAPGGSKTPGSSPTATPISPTTSSLPGFTNAAVVNSGSILAGFGLVIAYFL